MNLRNVESLTAAFCDDEKRKNRTFVMGIGCIRRIPHEIKAGAEVAYQEHGDWKESPFKLSETSLNGYRYKHANFCKKEMLYTPKFPHSTLKC